MLSGILLELVTNWRKGNGLKFLCTCWYIVINDLHLYGEQMNRKDRIKELEKKMKYIKSVLQQTQDELFLLKVEENQAKEKGHKAPIHEKTIA